MGQEIGSNVSEQMETLNIEMISNKIERVAEKIEKIICKT